MLSSILAATATKWVAGSIGALILGWILKKIPTDKWAKSWGEIGYKQGKAVSKFMTSKLPKLWAGVIEPCFISTIHAFIFAWWGEFKLGLESDN